MADGLNYPQVFRDVFFTTHDVIQQVGDDEVDVLFEFLCRVEMLVLLQMSLIQADEAEVGDVQEVVPRLEKCEDLVDVMNYKRALILDFLCRGQFLR